MRNVAYGGHAQMGHASHKRACLRVLAFSVLIACFPKGIAPVRIPHLPAQLAHLGLLLEVLEGILATLKCTIIAQNIGPLVARPP